MNAPARISLLDLPDDELRQHVRKQMFARFADALIEPGGNPDALAIFDDPAECGSLDAEALAWLIAQGITPRDIGNRFAVHAAHVTFPPGRRYAPTTTGTFAFVVAAIDIVGIVDAVAWSPTTNEIATRLGRAYALGQAQLHRDGLGTTGAALPVWRSPVGWLRHGRRGIVIADPVQAALALASTTLRAEDGTHARELDRLLRLPRPTIVSERLAA